MQGLLICLPEACACRSDTCVLAAVHAAHAYHSDTSAHTALHTARVNHSDVISYAALHAAELKDAGIPFAESQAALFCWLDLREGVHACRQQRGVATAEWEDEERFWEALSFKHGVFLTPGWTDWLLFLPNAYAIPLARSHSGVHS
eukprot:355515-Chlamydomonas_euryale.AAC.17